MSTSPHPSAPPEHPSRPPELSARERQVMDALHRLRRATVQELVEGVADGGTYSAVRAVLRSLHEKGHVEYRCQGRRYVYRPAVARGAARSRALHHLVRTFFDGSPAAAAVALLDLSEELTGAELRALDERIARARRREREARAGSGPGDAADGERTH